MSSVCYSSFGDPQASGPLMQPGGPGKALQGAGTQAQAAIRAAVLGTGMTRKVPLALGPLGGERVWFMTRTAPLPGQWGSPGAEPFSQVPSPNQSFLSSPSASVDNPGES